MDERQEIASDGEPLFSDTRAVNKDGRSGLKHTIPKRAQQLLDLDDNDEVKIDIYQDGYVVTKE